MTRAPNVTQLSRLADAIGACARARDLDNKSAAARAFILALQSFAPHNGIVAGNGSSRRGRKPKHDAAWCETQLLDIAITDPDGLPEAQAAMIERLTTRYEVAGKAVPSLTWLKAIVSRFYQRSRQHEMSLAREFEETPDLQLLFGGFQEFLTFRRARDRLEEKYRNDPALRSKYPTAWHYAKTVLFQRASTKP